MIEKARASGEFTREIDRALLIAMIHGPIYYRLLIRHQKLDQQIGEEFADHLMAHVKSKQQLTS